MSEPLYELQLLYLQDGTHLDQIYIELVRLGTTILGSIMHTKGFCYSPYKRKQILHDAATVFIETHYLTKQTNITHFYTMLRWNIYQQLGWAKRGKYSHQKHIDHEENIFDNEDYVLHTEKDIPEPLSYIKQLADQNKWIPYHLYKERSFKAAIEKILLLEEERWIIDNWRILHHVYQNLKRRSNRSKSLRLYCKNLKKNVQPSNLNQLLL